MLVEEADVVITGACGVWEKWLAARRQAGPFLADGDRGGEEELWQSQTGGREEEEEGKSQTYIGASRPGTFGPAGFPNMWGYPRGQCLIGGNPS